MKNVAETLSSELHEYIRLKGIEVYKITEYNRSSVWFKYEHEGESYKELHLGVHHLGRVAEVLQEKELMRKALHRANAIIN